MAKKATAKASKPEPKAQVNGNGSTKTNGKQPVKAEKPAVVEMPKLPANVQAMLDKAGYKLTKLVSPERSAAAKSAWETIRANREAGFKTTAEREAAEAAKAATVKAAKRGKSVKVKKAVKA
jgi:hypothetical protein